MPTFFNFIAVYIQYYRACILDSILQAGSCRWICVIQIRPFDSCVQVVNSAAGCMPMCSQMAKHSSTMQLCFINPLFQSHSGSDWVPKKENLWVCWIRSSESKFRPIFWDYTPG